MSVYVSDMVHSLQCVFVLRFKIKVFKITRLLQMSVDYFWIDADFKVVYQQASDCANYIVIVCTR